MPEEETTETKGLLRSGFVVSIMTMISRIFGLIRDMVIAYFFGAGAGADAFFLAFRIPNFFRRLFAEGAFAQAFVPVLSDYRENRSPAEVKSFIDRIAGSLGAVLLVFTLLGIFAAGLVITVFAPGFLYHGDTAKFELATDMLRLTFPYLLLISMTALSGSILNTMGKFAVPAFTPVLLNLSLIGCAVLLRPYLDEPVMALAWGVLIAGVAQLTFQIPFLASQGVLPVPKVDLKDPGVRRVGALMLPAIIGASVSQINLLVDTLLASFLETGSLSWLYYSDRLLELPLALFGITIATVILPGLSKDHATNSPEAFAKTLNWALRMIVLFGLPASIALVILSEPLIATLFYQGQMTAYDVDMAGLSLAAYGIGLLGHMAVKVLAPGFFARQDTATPVRYGIITLLTNIVLNLILVQYLQHAGLALATSLSAFLNALLLYRGLRTGKVLTIEPGWGRFLLQTMVGVAVMSAALFWLVPPIEFWLEHDFLIRLLFMLAVCLGGGLIYLLVIFLLGIRYQQLVR